MPRKGMRLASEMKLDFFKAIPVYPEFANASKLRTELGVKSKTLTGLVCGLLADVPLMENDHGALAFVSEPMKEATLDMTRKYIKEG